MGRVYWIDRCLGSQIVPARLREFGIDLRTYIELYPDDPTVPDERWILDVAKRGWVILTKDKNIRSNAVETDALRRARAYYVCLSAKNMRGEDQAACLIKHWKTIERLIASRQPPLIVTVTRTNVQWLHEGKWRVAKARK